MAAPGPAQSDGSPPEGAASRTTHHGKAAIILPSTLTEEGKDRGENPVAKGISVSYAKVSR